MPAKLGHIGPCQDDNALAPSAAALGRKDSPLDITNALLNELTHHADAAAGRSHGEDG